MDSFWKILLTLLLAALLFVAGYYIGMQRPPAYDTETLFEAGLVDGKMTIYRGDASPMPVEVEIGEQSDERLDAVVTATETGATYNLTVLQRQTTVENAAGARLATAVWDDASTRVSLLDAADDTVVSNPMSSTITLQSAHHEALPPDALALLNGEFVRAVLEEAENWTLLNRHQTNPLVLVTELNDLPREAALAITNTLIQGRINSRELIAYHHDVLNHGIPREFFQGHKTLIHELTEWLRTQTVGGEPLGLPFGSYPYWDPALPIPDAFGRNAPIAETVMKEYPMCSHFRPRVGVPEEYFLMNQPSAEQTRSWPCDPAESATWCETRMICDGDPHDLAIDPIQACEVIDPGVCPFGIIPQLQPEAICEFRNLQSLWSFMIEWHGDVHIRIGGASGSHPTTPTTPMFWAFHKQIDAVYDNWNSCS